jgi:hypothetical protein
MDSITVVRGLTMLKNLDKKILRITGDSEFVSVKGELRSPTDGSKNAVIRLQQISDLITFRQKLKSALIISNANTLIKVCGREMSVAESIEEKNSIKHKKSLLVRMKAQYASAISELERHNSQMRTNLETEARRANTDEKRSETTAKSSEEYQKGYMKLHKLELYDPINIKSEITNLETYIEDFESEVDHTLSESNAITTIQVPKL